MRDRSAFGYLEPVGDAPKFAQCKTCVLWLKDIDRCYWLQPNDEVLEGDTCIEYVQGPPIRSEDAPRVRPTGALTKQEVGFVRGDVRCENCNAFDRGDKACDLFRQLNKAFPKIWALDARVKPRACCNAFDGEVERLY
jgi:hypothetical protein